MADNNIPGEEPEGVELQARAQQEDEEDDKDKTEFQDAPKNLETYVLRTFDPQNVQGNAELPPLGAKSLQLQWSVRQQDRYSWEKL